jgi:lipopolysaccharide export system permease protein
MKKLDWYILKRFLVTFFFTILLITVIAVVIDASEKADDFVRSGLPTSQIITKYFFGFIPHIVGLIFPLIVFIAVIFFTSKLALRSEIIAILASGTTYNRMLRPFIMGGLILGAILWLANQYVIPRAQGLRSDFQAQYIDRNSSYHTGSANYLNYYMRVDSTTYVGIRSYDTISKTASGFFMHRMRNNKLVYNLRSERVMWDTSKKAWMLENALERTIVGKNESVKKRDTLLVKLNFLPSELRKDEYLKDKLTTPELDYYIEREELRGSEGLNTLKVERYRRDATPVAVLILSIIGAVVASRKVRGGSGFHLAIGIVTAATFILMDRFSTVFSIKGNFHPLLAAWLPNLIFAGIAYWLYKKAPK